MWTRQNILDLIESNDLAAMRGVCALFRRQTQDERASDCTRHLNGRGFSVSTAKAGSELAHWMTMGHDDGVMRRRIGGAMSFGSWSDSGAPRYFRRIEVCRMICRIHAAQLAEIANEGQQEAA